MRMTNKIMRNNSIYNINQNKILQDQLTNQMTSQSKIVRPSDDPVVAIRALRLRNNVSAVTQYNDKNAEDAKQWLKLTEDALLTINSVLNGLYEQSETGANKYQTSKGLKIIMEQMESLTKEFYSSGNVDYAGRFIFSGYRTDTPVTFTQADILEMGKHPVSFEIEEDIDYKQISTINYTNYDVVDGPAPGAGAASYEQGVTNVDLYRFRLSYNGLDSINGGNNNSKMPGAIQMQDKNGNTIRLDDQGLSWLDADGNPLPAGDPLTQITIEEEMDPEAAYKKVADPNFKGIVYCPTSGELIFGQEFYQNNFKEGDSFTFTYDKSSWADGDANPVHHFKCIETKDIGDGTMTDVRKTAYNVREKMEGKDQDIYYDVGFNQQIQVNTRADEVFTHDVRRDMDDFDHCLKELEAIEQKEKEIEDKMKEFAEGTPQYEDYQKKLDAVKKAGSYIRESIHNKFENQITKYQQYQDETRVAMTNNATRGSRLELIATRLTNQKATFKELQTDNEGIDVTEVAVELTSSEMTYSAALMATSKIMQTNLMNYI